MDSDLEICFWVRRYPFDGLLTVEVNPRTSIRRLKRHILEEFPELKPSGLESIYMVPEDQPILEDSSAKDKIGRLSIPILGEPLHDRQELSTLSYPPGHVHFIIDTRFLDVTFWHRATRCEASAVVSVSHGATVDGLKRIIKHEEPDLTCFRIYRIPWSDNLELAEYLGARDAGEMLNGGDLVRTVFRDLPFSEMPRVIIERVSDQPLTTVPSPSGHHSTDTRDPIGDARAAFLKVSTKAKHESPSGAGIPSSFRSRQGDKDKLIPCGRPRGGDETIPPILLNPVFGTFVDDCQAIEIGPGDYEFALNLADTMSILYDDEKKRSIAVRALFEQYGFDFALTKVGNNNKYQPDANMSVGKHFYVIAEFKNEIGGASAEPYFEAIAYYLEATRATAPKFTASPLPCLLLAMPGAQIQFAAAVWNLRPSAQFLSMVSLSFHFTDTPLLHMVARHLAAFRKATQTLRQYYEGLGETPSTAATPSLPHLFPHPTTYTLDDNALKHFRYESELCDPRGKKLLFSGKEHDDVCIKFVRTYSRAAHEYLASLGCAPALRCFERLPGGWFMVVMDRLPHDEFETLRERTSPLSASVRADMRAKLARLHNAGFVHGDIRDVNIMVSKSDKKQFMFVDFDWAGRAGDARYPVHVNSKDITRPKGAAFGKAILADHDIFMLEYIIGSLSDD